MKCYHVWFAGGSAILVDAVNEMQARCEAMRLRQYDDGPIVRIDCLDE